ncbi:OmpP1/FadL family transporter [Flavobacterium chuncheonense]|uniref:OmpP1/FadL family transporter n=1 Tax=Flavobacterium chuncheonense TaxID=2026653 RepID=A0ABW5YKM0_9FLAO
MRKIFLVSLVALCSYITNAQEISQQDALRYAITDLNGTARFQGMSGAFGAVGGDLSAISINPAGSLFFNNNFASFTGGVFSKSNKSNYFGTAAKDCDSAIDLNQAGAVFIFNNNNPDSDWKKISFGLTYENLGNFNNNIYIAGTNPTHSIDQYFLNFAQGIPEADLANYDYLDFGFEGQQASLAYQSYLIDPNPDPNSSNSYVSNVPTGGNYRQQNLISTTGFNGKVTGNFATSFKDILFLGANLNVHFTDYIKRTSLFESNSNNPNLGIQKIDFENEVYTYGTGFSLNVGAIVKPTKSLRLGIAYESPTWYRLRDELQQYIETVSTNGPDVYNDFYNPGVVNIYPVYKLQTPSKLTGSFAYIFGSSGLISFDIASKDYSNTAFKPKNEIVYSNLNQQMSSTLNNALEYRIGTEYKYKQASFRLGYRFEESPYKNDYYMSDLIGYSTGIGYSFGNNRLDLAYSYSERDYRQSLITSGMNDTANINNKTNNVLLTYSFHF